MAVCEAVGACIMTSLFMLYLTDYSGLGKLGAVLGSTVLVFARFFDAVNDPLEGWLIDRAKVGKHGKYRPFLLLSTVLIAVGLIGLFSIPVGENPNIILIGACRYGFLSDSIMAYCISISIVSVCSTDVMFT